MNRPRGLTHDIDRIFWVGYLIGWIGAALDVANTAVAVWLPFAIVGIGLCYASIMHTYVRDYLMVFILRRKDDSEQ